MVELKPCPFCGEEVYVEKVPMWATHNGITHGYAGCYEFDIHCRNEKCLCTVNLGRNDTIYCDEAEAKLNAIRAWNRRASDGRKHINM